MNPSLACRVATASLLAFSAAICGGTLFGVSLAGGLDRDDAAPGDLFGFDVSIDSSRAIVGSHRDDDAASSSGSAYLFDLATMTQTHKLTASDASLGDWFGYSVAISGNLAIVGSHLQDSHGSNSGAAYLFDANTGEQLFKLTPSDAAAADQFGHSVAIDGNIALVGSHFSNHAGNNSGAAYYFDTRTGEQLGILTASDAAAGDRFGFSVALNGARALIGSFRDDDDGSSSGSAYLFDLLNGSELLKFTPEDGSPSDSFGSSVSLSSNFAVIGSPLDDERAAQAGAVYIFDTASGAQVRKLTASDASAGDRFGESVASDGQLILAGSPRHDDGANNTGAAYLFDAQTDSEIDKLVSETASTFDFFGTSVALANGAALVGSHLEDSDGNNSGAAFFFSASPSEVPESISGYEIYASLAIVALFVLYQRKQGLPC